MRGSIPHAAESESRPRGGRHAQLEAAARHLAYGLRPMGIFTKKLLRRQAFTQLNQRVVHAVGAMRSSKPLRGISLTGFALWEYLPKNCFAGKLSRS